MTTTFESKPLGRSFGRDAEWCRRFVDRRCLGFISEGLNDEVVIEGSEDDTKPAVLSLAELDLAIDVQSAAQREHLAVLALGFREPGPEARASLAMRFVTPSVMRSAGRAYGSQWLVNDVAIPSPVGLEDVSLLVYRIRRTPHLGRALLALETTLDALEGAGDSDNLVLARAVLEQLEVFDDREDAAIVLSGRGLRFAASERSRSERYVGVVATDGASARVDGLWLIGRKLHQGPDRASATRVDGRPHLLLRYGPRSQQNVREFIDEVRRRHQARPSEAASEKSEAFATFVDRLADQRKKDVIKATFGHHNMLPVVTPIALEVSANLAQTVALTDEPPSRFKQLITGMREFIDANYGLLVPGVRVRLNETDLPDGAYIFMLDEVPLVMGNVNSEQALCLASVDELVASLGANAKELGVTAAALPDGSGRAACWIPSELDAQTKAAGFETWDAAEYIEAHLRSVVIQNMDLFAPLDELERSFDKIEPGDPDGNALLARVKTAPGGLPRFAEVARSLLVERLPLKPLRSLTLRYLEVADAPLLDGAEEVRRVPELNAHITRGAENCRLFLLSEDYEATVRRGVNREGDAAVMSLTPELTQQLLAAVRQEVPSPDAKAPVVLVVEDARLRPFIRSLLVLEFPHVQVVARREVEGLPVLPVPTATITI